MKMLTTEEQLRWSKAMVSTWHTIAPDVIDGMRFEARMSGKCERLTPSMLVEMVCDANRLEQFGGLTAEEGKVLGAMYGRPSFQRWARSIMRGYADVVLPPPKPRALPKMRLSGPKKVKPTLNYWARAGYATYAGPPRRTAPARIFCK